MGGIKFIELEEFLLKTSAIKLEQFSGPYSHSSKMCFVETLKNLHLFTQFIETCLESYEKFTMKVF